MISKVFSRGCKLYGKGIIPILLICFFVYIPLETIASLISYSLFDSEALGLWWGFDSIWNLFVRILPETAMIIVALAALKSLHDIPGESTLPALKESVKLYPKMLVTRFLFSLSALSFIFLIIPGFYIMTKLALAEILVVTERRSAMDALKRSWDLTNGVFWPVFAVLFLTFCVLLAVVVPIIIGLTYIEALADTWFVDAIIGIPLSFAMAFWYCIHVSLWEELQAEPISEEQAIDDLLAEEDLKDQPSAGSTAGANP